MKRRIPPPTLIVHRDAALEILAGRAGTVRQPASGDRPSRFRAGMIYDLATGKGREPLARVEVLHLARGILGTVEHDDARDAGYQDIGAFIDGWVAQHGDFDIDQPVWVLTVKLAATNLLASRSQYGYTDRADQAVQEEPEAIDAAIVERLPATLEARQRWQLAKAEQDAAEFTGTIGERLDRVLAEAKRAGVDTTGVEWALVRKVQQLEHRNRRAA